MYLLLLLLVLFSFPVDAQHLIRVKDAQREYISFTAASSLIFAAAVERAKPKNTDSNLKPADGFQRALSFYKLKPRRNYLDHSPGTYSYLTIFPALLLSDIFYGETLSYQFDYSGIKILNDYDRDAYSYFFPKDIVLKTIPSSFNPNVRIYEPNIDFAFKDFPYQSGTTVSTISNCKIERCLVYKSHPVNFYKWYYYKDKKTDVAFMCNDPSDCVRSYLSDYYYRLTYSLRSSNSSLYRYGFSEIIPNGNCADYVHFGGFEYYVGHHILCSMIVYTDATNQLTGYSDYFYLSGSTFDLTLSPLPFVCPGAKLYIDFLSCGKRFQDDVFTPASLALIINKVFFSSSQVSDYRGFAYTPVVAADVIKALNGRFVKVSSLAEEISPPDVASFPVPGPVGSSDSGGSSGLDFGPDPGIAAPLLDSAPDSSFLDSVFDLFPSFRAYSAGSHLMECPTYSPNIFGSVVSISSHCDLLESQRSALGLISMVLWAGTVFVVVLRA